jgi:hypothetical protein
MRIEVEAPSDDLSEAVVKDLLAERDMLKTAGVSLVRRDRANFVEPLSAAAGAICITLLGEVISHYAIRAIDTLIASRKRHRHFSAPIEVRHGEHHFTLPRDYDACVDYLKDPIAPASNHTGKQSR